MAPIITPEQLHDERAAAAALLQRIAGNAREKQEKQRRKEAMGSMFKRGHRTKLWLRCLLDGLSGSGKSYTGLTFAHKLGGLFPRSGDRPNVAVIDTEFRSAEKYHGETHDGQVWDFDVCNLEHFDPATYTVAIGEAAAAGYPVLLIDGLSQAWAGVGGALEQVDKNKSGNSFTAWKDVTPKHNELVAALLSYPGHLIVTMRTKVEYVLEEGTNKAGKSVIVPKKVGMKPVQREGMEYEFDIVCDMDQEHELIVSKSRCSAIDGKRITKPTGDFLEPVIRWLNSGAEQEQQPKPQFINGHNGNGAPAAVESAPAATEPPPFVPSGPAAGESIDLNGPAQKYQIDNAVGLMKEMQLTPQWLTETLAKKGKAKLSELTAGEIDKLLAFLRQQSSKQQAAQTF